MRLSTPTLSLFSFLWLSGLCMPILASRGDQLVEFRDCVKFCIHQNCAFEPTPLPLHLRLLFWTCPQECDYSCQRTITSTRIAQSLPVEQFHGKWPFRRILGVQEPFSVLFSLANLYAHLVGLRLLRRELHEGYGMRRFYMWFGYLGVLCWTASAVFHTRDFLVTERADYFAAGANVLYGLFLAVVRVGGLYEKGSGGKRGDDATGKGRKAAGRKGGKVKGDDDEKSGEEDEPYIVSAISSGSIISEKPTLTTTSTSITTTSTSPTTPTSSSSSRTTRPTPRPSRAHLLPLLSTLCITLYLCHISYLTFIHWSYTYNMLANVLVGALTNLLWTAFSIRHYRRLKKMWAAWPGLIVTLVVLAMSLELLDFPPLADALDAHALWHAATVAPTLWWYRFVVRDAREEEEEAGMGGLEGKKVEGGKDLIS